MKDELIKQYAKTIRDSANYTVNDAGAPGYGETISIGFDCNIEALLSELWNTAAASKSA